MKRYLLSGLFFFSFFCAIAQKGDELLVYAVKGKVTSVYKSKETPVKIGKVLLPGSIVKTQKDASLTMLCTKGKPISLTMQGSFPVTRWRDSCRVTSSSITTNYFKYIWDQMYSYSPEKKERLRRRSDGAVARGEPNTGNKPKKFTKLEFNKGMDTVNYDGNSFPLSWNGSNYKGYYHFTLFDTKGEAILYQDSLKKSFIVIDSFKHVLKEGESYYWTVLARGAPVSKKRVLNFILPQKTTAETEQLMQPLPYPEDSATISFRVAYILEQKHYLAEAYTWYQQASSQNPEMELYRDKLIRFRNEYWIR